MGGGGFYIPSDNLPQAVLVLDGRDSLYENFGVPESNNNKN